MLLRQEDVQTNANLWKVVQTDILGCSLYNSPARGSQWHAPCGYAHCEYEMQCEEA